jgi:hypothetical protein
MKHDIRTHHLLDAVVWTASLMFLVLLAMHEAHAGGDRFDPGPAIYRDECGSCHVAYPAALLRPAQWSAIVGRLDEHFGVNASVDAAAAAQIAAYVGAHKSAAATKATTEELPRISTQRWFLREHLNARDSTSVGRIRSMSDCAACHRQAAQGDFSESSLRLTR